MESKGFNRALFCGKRPSIRTVEIRIRFITRELIASSRKLEEDGGGFNEIVIAEGI